ncbi:MAG: hypothetical protein V3S32_03300 [Acidimicrobiia bacterium]
MRKHEIELITALAEGALEDETEARALVASSEKARSEYEAQRIALDALATVPPATLTDGEKATLHRDVWTELSASPSGPQKATPWYFRWSYAAAGLFLVVGLFAILNTGGFSDDDAATEELAASRDAGETADTTVATGGADQAAGAPTVAEDSAADVEAGTADPIVEFFREQASRVRSGQLYPALAFPEKDQSSVATENSACLTSAGLDEYEALGEITFDEALSYGLNPEAPYLVAVPAGSPIDESTPVAFVDLLTCDRIHIDE